MNKTLRRIAIYTLTGGASLYLGLLSLGGMYALVPIVPLAVLSFVLSVAYEGEIYLQNLTQAVKKLFKSDSLERAVTKSYLKHLFDARIDSLPEFFQDYKNLVLKASHSRRHKKQLKDLEKLFAQTVFGDPRDVSGEYQTTFLNWLNQRDASLRPQFWIDYKQKQATLQKWIAMPLSLLAGVFSALGTTFLLFETINIVPALAAVSLNVWGIAFIPLALVAGLSYGLLTYNSITNFMINNPFSHWFGKIMQTGKDKRYIEATVMAVAFTALCGLAGALTVCTAGTWLTIVNENSSIYRLITELPKWVMGVMNPIVTTFSSLAFNLQNTSSSLRLLMPYIMAPFNKAVEALRSLRGEIADVWKRETWLQFINPFRLMYECLFEPLRKVLFIGHLASIGVTSDRVPGFSKIGSAWLGFIAEFGEDTHYFFGHKCGGADGSLEEALEEHLEGDGHNHNLDLPTRFLEICLSPLAVLGDGWNKAATWLIPPSIAQVEEQAAAHHDSCCHGDHHHHDDHASDEAADRNAQKGWQAAHPIWFMENYRKRHTALLSDTVKHALDSMKAEVQANTLSLKASIEKHQNELPEDFKRRFEARFG